MTEPQDVSPWTAPEIASQIADTLSDTSFEPRGEPAGVFWDADDPDPDMQVVWLQQPGQQVRFAVAVLRFEADEDEDEDWYVEATVGHVDEVDEVDDEEE